MGKSSSSRKPSKRTTARATSRIQEKQFSDVCGIEVVGLPGFDQVEELEGFSDAATVLTDKLNQLLMSAGDHDLFTEDFVKQLLVENVHPQILMNHIEDDFGQGILVGHLLAHADRDLQAIAEENEEENS